MALAAALAARARSWGAVDVRKRLTGVLALALMGVLIVPLLMTVFAPSAHADDQERDNYSLYQLASNASTYFSQANSPEGRSNPADRMTADWRSVTSNPATGGDMLGYADSKFSIGDVVGWLFAEISGSSQTIGYGTLKASDGSQGTDIYAGMLDYAHFGATNADLGLDTMSSGIGGQILRMLSGSVIWVLYALALAVGMLFYLVIQLLKLSNPFTWFYQAVFSINETLGRGMVCSSNASGAETCHTGAGALAGLQNWISDWYGALNSLAWEAFVPLFIAFTILGLILFKSMDRGSAIKKLIVRVVFIGVGLPLIGSMYTGVLDKFDDSLMGQHAGATRVVLSTYVDFEAWAMKDRLGIPDEATIAWDNGQASSEAMMSVRTSALAINKQSHGSTYSDISVGNKATNAEQAWKDGMTGVDRTNADDANAVFTTFGLIGNYINSNEVASSDFESGIKSAITKLDVDNDVKKEWFIGDKGYGDLDKFGEETDYGPTNHPVLSVGGNGLISSHPGGNSTTYSTGGTKSGCGFTVWTDGAPASCNVSALSMYNYLNTGFGPDSLTMYSSNNATSGFTRENHMAVSQVGTGPAKFMYWFNAATVLGSIALVGFWYAIGMLAGAVKRTFSLVAAIPFATLGSLAAISKVIVHSVALILEVLVTLFIYQFVSQFLISIPDIIAGPMSRLMSPGGLFGSAVLGGIVVVILTLISSLMIMGVTFALLRVRKVVLQAMDEVFTKLVDKFLETNTSPTPDKGGMLPALAAGAGAGAGMALGAKLASGLGDKIGGNPTLSSDRRPGSKTTSTNAGGTNADPRTLTSGTEAPALAAGDRPGGGPAPIDGGDGPGPGGGNDGGPKALPGGSGSAGAAGSQGDDGDGDNGGPLQLTSGKGGSSHLDKETAQNLSSRGGLSDLGYTSGSPKESGDAPGAQTHVGTGGAPTSTAPGEGGKRNGSGGPDGPGGTARTSGDRTAIAGQSSSTQFGTSRQPGASGSPGTDGSAQPNPGRAGGFPAPGPQASAPVPDTPAIAGTSSPRAAQGQRPQPQPGTGPRRPRGGQEHRQMPSAGTQVQAGGQRPQAQSPAPAPAGRPTLSRPAPLTGGHPQNARQRPPQSAPRATQSRSQQAPATRPMPSGQDQQGPAAAAAPQQATPASAPVPQLPASAAASGSQQRTAAPQPTVSKSAPALKPASGSGQSAQQQPAKPRRAADPAPKRTDGPVSQRKPDGSKD